MSKSIEDIAEKYDHYRARLFTSAARSNYWNMDTAPRDQITGSTVDLISLLAN